MPHFVYALIIQSVFFVVLFGIARLIAWAVMRFVPDGKLKRTLMYDDGKFP